MKVFDLPLEIKLSIASRIPCQKYGLICALLRIPLEQFEGKCSEHCWNYIGDWVNWIRVARDTYILQIYGRKAELCSIKSIGYVYDLETKVYFVEFKDSERFRGLCFIKRSIYHKLKKLDGRTATYRNLFNY